MKRYLNKNNSMCVIKSMQNNVVKKAAKNLVVSDFCINTHTHTHNSSYSNNTISTYCANDSMSAVSNVTAGMLCLCKLLNNLKY